MKSHIGFFFTYVTTVTTSKTQDLKETLYRHEQTGKYRNAKEIEQPIYIEDSFIKQRKSIS